MADFRNLLWIPLSFLEGKALCGIKEINLLLSRSWIQRRKCYGSMQNGIPTGFDYVLDLRNSTLHESLIFVVPVNAIWKRIFVQFQTARSYNAVTAVDSVNMSNNVNESWSRVYIRNVYSWPPMFFNNKGVAFDTVRHS